MKILHLITRMDGGGSAVNTLITATKQAESSHDVLLAFGPSQDSKMTEQEQNQVDTGLQAFEDLGGKVEVLANLQREVGLHDKRAVKDIRALGLDAFDIVHTHTSKAGALGRYAADGKNVKVCLLYTSPSPRD